MIRPYRPEDRDSVVRIANRAWQGIYDAYVDMLGLDLFDALVPDRETGKGRQLAKQCDEAPERIYVCEEDGRLVGFVTFWLNREQGIGYIGNNAVAPECGLKGKGQEMYRAVLDHFRREGMRFAGVGTGGDPGHARARRAYERAGFDIIKPDVHFFMRLDGP